MDYINSKKEKELKIGNDVHDRLDGWMDRWEEKVVIGHERLRWEGWRWVRAGGLGLRVKTQQE